MNPSLLLASFVVAVLVIGLPLVFHLTRYLGARSDNIRKNEPYESGIRQTIGDPFDAFGVKYFLVGIVFLLFDVEVLYLFPWALELRRLGMFGLIEMFAFLGLLVAGLVYAFRAGILRWI